MGAKKKTKYRKTGGFNEPAETAENVSKAAEAPITEETPGHRETAEAADAPERPSREPAAQTRMELGSRFFALLSSPNLEITGEELAALEALAAGCETGWLSASILALCAWFRDDPEKARAYIEKSVFIDSHSTSLLYTLLMRRIDRPEAAAAWLTRYLDYQDPARFDGSALNIADALQEGLFGEYGGRHLQKKAAAWYDALLLEPGFLEKQRAEWSEFFSSMTPEIDDGDYPTLSSAVVNWKELKDARAWALARGDIADRFSRIASGGARSRGRLEDGLNAMLVGLADGGEDKTRVDLSESLVRLVTDPESGREISNGARRMLLSMSRDTMAEEYARHDKKMGGAKPVAALVGIAGWYGSYNKSSGNLAELAALVSVTGRSGARNKASGSLDELRESLRGHLDWTRTSRASEIRVSSFNWVVLITGLIFLALGIAQFNPLFIVIALIPVIYWLYVKIEAKKKAADFEREYSYYETEALSVFDRFASEIDKFDAVYAEPEEGV